MLRWGRELSANDQLQALGAYRVRILGKPLQSIYNALVPRTIPVVRRPHVLGQEEIIELSRDGR